jgi:5'-nucleotidase
VKNIIALLLALVMCVSLSACAELGAFGESDTESKAESNAPSNTQSNTDSDIKIVESGNDKPDLDVEGHADSDNDKKCDDCGISVVTTFDFYAINDLHGKFVTSGNTVGVEGLTTYMKTSSALDDNPIFLSSGDMWQGGSYSNLTQGKIITDWMNYMNFSSMTLGNHEFDWGEEPIAQNAEIAKFPFLAINIYDKSTNKRVDYCDGSVLVESRGLQIGIIGAIGDCYSSISSEKVEGVYFKTGSALAELVKEESKRLRDMGADLIVFSLHDGGTGSIGSYYPPELSRGYVDIVFEGHSHYSYVLRDSSGVYHLQNKGDNGGISHAEIEYNFANGNHSVAEAEHVPAKEYSSLEADEVIETLLEKYKDTIAKADEKLGTNSTLRDSDTLRSLVAKLYFEAGEARWGDKYDIVLGGGYMSVRSPGYLHAGTVTYGDLQTILPFDNELVLCSIKGRDLVSKFLQTSNDNYFIYCGDYGNSIKNRIDQNATYYLITDSYSSTYAPNRLTEVARYDANVFARDLLADYIKAGGLDSGTATLTSIPDAISIGMKLPAGGVSQSSYRVRGEIVSVYNTTYGNMIIKDEQGNTLTVYGVSDANGTRYDKMSNPPKVGDVVTFEAPIKHYVSGSEVIIELFQSYLVG